MVATAALFTLGAIEFVLFWVYGLGAGLLGLLLIAIVFVGTMVLAEQGHAEVNTALRHE